MSRYLTARPARIVLSTLITLVLHTGPALADQDHHDRYNDRTPRYEHNRHDDHHDNRRWDHDDHRGDQGRTVIYRTPRPEINRIVITPIDLNPWQADILRHDLSYRYGYELPHGLYGSYPGHTRRYMIGAPLPAKIIWTRVPRHVAYHLPPAPRGTFYAYADNDLVLLTEATKSVMDAIVLISAYH